MKKPSSNMKAALVLAQHKYLGPIITPALNIENDSINWPLLGYHGQSGSTQTVLSFLYCLFTDSVPPEDWKFRDPFEGLNGLDRDIMVLVFQAMAARYGFVSLSVEDQPKSNVQKMVEGFGEQMAKDEKRKGFKVIKPEDE